MTDRLIILARKQPHQLLPGWALCPTCGRQVRLTTAGLLYGHYRKGESHHMGVEPCPTKGTAP